MWSQSTKERKAKLKCETPKKKFDGCCHVEMPNEDSKIHREKSLKVPFIIYFDLECLLEKMSLENRDIKDHTNKFKDAFIKIPSESKELFLKIITNQ